MCLGSHIPPPKSLMVNFYQSQYDLRFAGHYLRNTLEMASKVLLWEPKHGRRSMGPPRKDFICQLKEDTGLEAADLENCMKDRVLWRSHQNCPTIQSP